MNASENEFLTEDINNDTLIEILKGEIGVELRSYGKPRDGFELPIDVPNWTSGFGGKYEMKHTNVPKGVMIAVGDLQTLDLSDQAKLKTQLEKIDIYPTGHSGDFTGQKTEDLTKWFWDRSRRDDARNNQEPIAHAKKLSREGLGEERYNDLVSYLTENMTIFKDRDHGNALVPADPEARKQIVQGLLDGLSKTVRYTRMDDPATAFQLCAHVRIMSAENNSAIHYNLSNPDKIIVLRKDKSGQYSISPLDREMLGKTYITRDGGTNLGDEGVLTLTYIRKRAEEIEGKLVITVAESPQHPGLGEAYSPRMLRGNTCDA